MFIGILSDTHENEPAIQAALALLGRYPLEFIVHCGDIISPPVLENFQGFKVRFVFGNNDGEEEGLRAKVTQLGLGSIDEELTFSELGKTFHVYHGTSARHLQKLIDSQRYDYILTGHTHVVRDETIGRTRVINPGALFRAPRYTCAVLDIASGRLEILEIPKN
jgi:putative phosphoesterase